MGDAYEIKKVSQSFKDALAKVVSQESVVEKAEAESVGLVNEGVGTDKAVAKKATRTADDHKASEKYSKALGNPNPDKHKAYEDVDAETSEEVLELTEEQLCEVLEEELGPHIAYLLDEGFSEQEIEDLIVEMLTEDEEDKSLEEGWTTIKTKGKHFLHKNYIMKNKAEYYHAHEDQPIRDWTYLGSDHNEAIKRFDSHSKDEEDLKKKIN